MPKIDPRNLRPPVFAKAFDEVPERAKNGRGAVGNAASRFDATATSATDDGWLYEDEDAPKLRTTLHVDTSRTVINQIDSPDVGLMRSINPYRGCEHGCIYCFARPSHNYLGYSSGLDFETEIFYKPDAPDLLLRELAAKSYTVQPITLGSNTDCYQPVEREVKLTRRIVEILHDHDHPLQIVTKSALVLRDLDLLAAMAQKGLASVAISVTTLDPALARVMEPRAAAPHRRLDAIRALAAAGVPVTVMAAPLIPALNDMEMEKILAAAWAAGARSARYTLVRLAHDLKELFSDWLRTHRPERAKHVLSLIRDTRGGQLYDSRFDHRMHGTGAYADLLATRFRLATKRLGYNESHQSLRVDLFRQPNVSGQLGFAFD
ncbi:MAG: PA0069 family radical SAM protein [Pseudomonadota bacterium]|nr:PA0069 family radical SAM protein [Pseudomonadota bacterium]